MKTFRTLGAFALCAAMGFGFASCDKDGGEPSGDGSTVVIDGTRLTSINNVEIYYDAQGRVSGLSSPYACEIDYSKGKVIFDYDDEEVSVKFTKEGYLSEIKSSWNEQEDDYSYSGSGKIKFSYNGSGNLTKMEAESSETEKDLSTKEKYTYSGKWTVSFTWKGGNMVSAVDSGYEDEDGDRESWTDRYTVEYDGLENAFRQNPFCLTDIAVDDTQFGILGAAGLLGKGPSELPSDIEVSYDGDTYNSSVSFNLNSNGSISYERSGYSGYNYGYSEYSGGKGGKFGTKAANQKPSLRKMFVRRTHKK